MKTTEFPWKEARELTKKALEEDVGSGDITTRLTIPESNRSTARIIAKESGVFCGGPFLELAYADCSSLRITKQVKEASAVKSGDLVAEIEGPTSALLTGERVLLNFVQRLSGISSRSSDFSRKLAGTQTKILDTRKTLPAYRLLDKYAVRCGGGENHRMGLYDMVLVKENHILGAGGIHPALKGIFAGKPEGMRVEVEVESPDQLDDVLAYPVDWILLDNMPLEILAAAIATIRKSNPKIRIEASGNMELARVRSVAECGVDFISVGALTHSVPALDLSMRFD